MTRHLHRTDDASARSRSRTNNLRISIRAIGASLSRSDSICGGLAAQRSRNPVTLCDGYGALLVAASAILAVAAEAAPAAR
jgi:hypothetical protein